MKVSYKHLIKTYRGKKDGLVYYYHPGLKRFIARAYVVPKPTDNNRRFAAVVASLKALQISPGYVQDLKVFQHLLQSHAATEDYSLGTYWTLFTKLMWAQARSANLDLETLTRAEIEALDLPCRTVKTAVEAGLLPEVTGYELLVREM